MKKLIPLLLLLSACSLSYAESMKFITVLSSPVGAFNKLEAVDSTQPAKGNTVNFCTNIGTQGVVELKGTKPTELSTVVLSNNTTLGKTDEGKFSLSKIELHSGGSIKGGRLFGNTVTVNNAASGKANNLYGNELTVAGAKTKTLDVNNGASKITAQHDGADMVWSNEYSCGEYLDGTSGAGTVSEGYVDPKSYLSDYSYIGNKPRWYAWDGDNETREFDLNCGCVYCFDEGSQGEWPLDSYKSYFANATPALCSAQGIKNVDGLAAYVNSSRDPSYYAQFGFNLSSNFYNWDYIMGGHYGSNSSRAIVNEDSCYANIGDIGPNPLSVRQKSYAVGCLIPAPSAYEGKYYIIYCAFWKCRDYSASGEAGACKPGTEGVYKDQFLLKSR